MSSCESEGIVLLGRAGGLCAADAHQSRLCRLPAGRKGGAAHTRHPLGGARGAEQPHRLSARRHAACQPRAGPPTGRLVLAGGLLSGLVLRRMDPLFPRRTGDRAAAARVPAGPAAAGRFPGPLLSVRGAVAAESAGGDPDADLRRGTSDSVDPVVFCAGSVKKFLFAASALLTRLLRPRIMFNIHRTMCIE